MSFKMLIYVCECLSLCGNMCAEVCAHTYALGGQSEEGDGAPRGICGIPTLLHGCYGLSSASDYSASTLNQSHLSNSKNNTFVS